MMPNGLVGSWMLKGPEAHMFMTGLTEEATERLGRKWAEDASVAFRRIA